ncbi:hypothetical protein B0H11DRAFT_1921416 [Mycena galericulata]|nr:hypothetical protein B0H11DRAFT_1921416 [Mycena galericulata]
MHLLFTPGHDGGKQKAFAGILAQCDWVDITNLLRTSRGVREGILLVFAKRYDNIVSAFFPARVRDFSMALVLATGGINGSGAYRVGLPAMPPTTDNLNVLVPAHGAHTVEAYLASDGWADWLDNVKPTWAGTATSHTGYQKMVKGAVMTVTVTRTTCDSIVPHVLAAEHSLGAMILTPTCITFFGRPGYTADVRTTTPHAVVARLRARNLGVQWRSSTGDTKPVVGGLIWARLHRLSEIRDFYSDELTKMFVGLDYMY